MLPKALKTCPKSNKSPNLVTLLATYLQKIVLFTSGGKIIKIKSRLKDFCVKNQILGSGVAQLVDQSLPIPEARGSNPVVGKIYLYLTFVYCQLYIKKTK